MLSAETLDRLNATLTDIDRAGLMKRERMIETAQSSQVSAGGKMLVNFCSNNYLGLANHPKVVASATAALERWGFGMASVRFICGTQTQHRDLENALSEFLGTEDTVLFSSCFDANGGLFEALFAKDDVIISDELNHASLIDGIRLSSARRLRYRNRDMSDLEDKLQGAAEARMRVIVSDGVFSMDGSYAPLDEICDLAERYDALVVVDDSHATGFVGPRGRGTPEHFGVEGRVDVLTGTLGKALGGASGGFVSARSQIVELLRQRARPYLFSNAVPPSVVSGSLTALHLAAAADGDRKQLMLNAEIFRGRMESEGFSILPGNHPIVAIMFPGDQGAEHASRIATDMLERGIYVIAFSFPVVPRGEARIRVQLSAAHSEEDVENCVQAFVAARSGSVNC